MHIGLHTLGCDKNTVDHEYLAGLLAERGCKVTFVDGVSSEGAFDAVVVITCGFIQDAKIQSIEALMQWAECKKADGRPKSLIAAGCLSQRYADELLAEIPELDHVFGVGQFEAMAELLTASPPVSCDERKAVCAVPVVEVKRYIARKRSSTAPYGFLKVADGCNHDCTFCSIPAMKGKYRSVPEDILVEEAKALLGQGVRELVLVAQDVSAYGRDWGEGSRLVGLLKSLASLCGDFWIRCMYMYPAGLTGELLDLMAEEPKIVPYLDVPLQHLDPGVLRLMKRPAAKTEGVALFERLRSKVPGIALRTTMIVGFPGETNAAFKHMLKGLDALSANWLGAFMYSPEEGTPAATERQVGQEAKERRWRELMEAQAEITRSLNEGRVGVRTRVLVEEYDAESGVWLGRSPAEAPEVDGCVYIQGAQGVTVGDFVDAEITGADGYDVWAHAL